MSRGLARRAWRTRSFFGGEPSAVGIASRPSAVQASCRNRSVPVSLRGLSIVLVDELLRSHAPRRHLPRSLLAASGALAIRLAVRTALTFFKWALLITVLAGVGV